MSKFRLIIAGTCIGIGNLLPGISGATIAIFFNIYEDILIKLSDSFKNPRFLIQHLKFFIPIGIGAIFGIFGFSFFIDYLIANNILALKWTLIFLISTQIIPLWSKKPNLDKKHYGIFGIFLILMLVLSFTLFLKESALFDQNSISMPYLFLSGFFAAAALILPGLSGSLILVLLGSYRAIIVAIKSIEWLNLAMVFGGALLGLASLSIVMKWLYQTHRSFTYSAILGLVIGSLAPIWPNQFSLKIQCITLLISCLGFALSWKIQK